MYTLEEINEAARAKGWKMFWVWFITFGIGFPIGLPLIMMTLGVDVNLSSKATIGYLKSVIWGSLLFAVLSGAVMSAVASINTKKKMKEENEQEEQRNRDDHYKKMEELLEKLSKERE